MVWFTIFVVVSVVGVLVTAGVMDWRARERRQRIDGGDMYDRNRDGRRGARAERMYRYHPFDTNKRHRSE